jgi:hypothetical protein
MCRGASLFEDVKGYRYVFSYASAIYIKSLLLLW